MNALKSFLTLTILLAFSASGLAGPFRTAIVQGVVGTDDLTIPVPAGRAIAIVNFVSDEPGVIRAVINNISTPILKAISTQDAGLTTKEVVIDGPATLTVNVEIRGFLTYRIFAN